VHACERKENRVMTRRSTPSAGPTAGSGDPASIGTAFVEALARGDWAGAQVMEDPVMAAAVPASKLQQLAQLLAAQYGAYQSIGSVTATPPSLRHDRGRPGDLRERHGDAERQRE